MNYSAVQVEQAFLLSLHQSDINHDEDPLNSWKSLIQGEKVRLRTSGIDPWEGAIHFTIGSNGRPMSYAMAPRHSENPVGDLNNTHTTNRGQYHYTVEFGVEKSVVEAIVYELNPETYDAIFGDVTGVTAEGDIEFEFDFSAGEWEEEEEEDWTGEKYPRHLDLDESLELTADPSMNRVKRQMRWMLPEFRGTLRSTSGEYEISDVPTFAMTLIAHQGATARSEEGDLAYRPAEATEIGEGSSQET